MPKPEPDFDKLRREEILIRKKAKADKDEKDLEVKKPIWYQRWEKKKL